MEIGKILHTLNPPGARTGGAGMETAMGPDASRRNIPRKGWGGQSIRSRTAPKKSKLSPETDSVVSQ